MATIDPKRTTLVPRGSGTPAITPHAAGVNFTTPQIRAVGNIVLTGTPGESLFRWTLGYVQLKFIGTDYCRYRGATVRQGSVLVTKNNQILCRDTDEATPEVWYDPIVWGIHSGRGTRILGSPLIMPASGEFPIEAIFEDAPGRFHEGQTVNPNTHQTNFLHQSDIALHFCTILVAQDPAGTMIPLKHFYWNVRWEAHFRPDVAGNPTIHKLDLHELNIQRHIHSGVPNDHRFRGKEFDMHLPISNDVSRRPARNVPADDWAQG